MDELLHFLKTEWKITQNLQPTKRRKREAIPKGFTKHHDVDIWMCSYTEFDFAKEIKTHSKRLLVKEIGRQTE